MKSELDDLLCQRYSDLFRDRHGDPVDTSMCWGFCCGDGWYGILDHAVRRNNEPGTVNKGCQPVVVSQVKEKFGTLAVFTSLGGACVAAMPKHIGLFAAACQLALTTCEQCGAPGEMVGAGVETVLCPTCAKQRFAPDVNSHF
jgi:hypothetical protein